MFIILPDGTLCRLGGQQDEEKAEAPSLVELVDEAREVLDGYQTTR